MPTNNVATVALQLEKVRKNIPLWFRRDKGLYSLIKAKADVEVTSSRALRLPIQLDQGGAAMQTDMDGSDLGIGTSADWQFLNATPIYFAKGFSLTKAAEFATDSSTKAVESATKRMVTDATNSLLTTLESLLNTDGSATLSVISAVSTNTLTVTNPNSMQRNQVVQILSALGGTNRGSCTVLGVNANAGTVTVDAAPSGTIANDLIVLQGAPGTAASSLFGLEYVNTAATTGSYLGLSRTTYPQLRSNHVAGGAAAIAITTPRLLLNQIRQTLGVDAGKDIVFHMGPDQTLMWEALSTAVQRIDIESNGKRDSTVDILAGEAPMTMAGHKIVESIHAVPGRIDALNLGTFGRAEVAPVDVLEFGGQTLFPQISTTSGGVASATLGYIVTGVQTWCDNPLANGFIDGLSTTPA